MIGRQVSERISRGDSSVVNLVCEREAGTPHRSEEAVDEEFTDAEIRALLKRVAMDRRQAEIRNRQELAGDPSPTREEGTAAESPRESPARKQAA